MAVLVDLEKVTATRAEKPLFDQISLTVGDGDRVGVVGINGTGKSTLLRVVAGAERPEAGSVRRGRGTRVGYLEQEPALGSGTVRDAVGEGWEADAALDRLGMASAVGSDVSLLSGGEAKRVALARVLSRPAELLVLDEPTNHLDLAAVGWLEQRLLAFRGGLVLVTHDRHLLERVTTRMVELDRGRIYVHEGSYDSYLSAQAERGDQAASAEAVRRNLARRELAWLRRGAKARSRKPQARIDAATRLVGGGPEAPARQGELALGFSTPRLGDKVIECVDVAFRHDGAAGELLSGVDLVLDPRERLAVVGGNGTGKSTLLDLLAGRRAPTRGRIATGPTVEVGYYNQQGADLDPEARVQDVVAGPTRAPGAPEDIALMERFWFTGELPFARVGTLSGGERRRLQLLVVLAGRPNVLLLDEPTNDLDLDTLRILEDLLETWPGALVVVSHDRTFLERTTGRVVAVDAHGAVSGVPGGVEGWLQRAKASSPPARRRTAEVDRGDPGRIGTARPLAPELPGGRSSSTIGRMLRDAERSLGRLERARDELAEAVSETREHDELTVLGTALAEAQARLEEAEEQWLAVAEEAERR